MSTLAPTPRLRVMLVEDSLPIRQRIKSLIEESNGLSVIGETSTVAGALALLARQAPDAAVLDLQLADGTGYSVLEEIKRNWPQCAVLVMTNFAIPEYRERCRALGADYFLEKSTDFEQVRSLLERLRSTRHHSMTGVTPAPATAPGVAPAANAGASTPAPHPEHHFRHLLDVMPAALFTCDTSGRITFYNAAAVELFGGEPDVDNERWCGAWRILTQGGEVLAPADYPTLQALQQNRAIPGVELVAEHADGTRKNISCYPQPLRDAAGVVTGTLTLMIDVTETKRAEQALIDSEEQNRMLFEASLDAIFTGLPGESLGSANPAACRLFGLSESDLCERGRAGLIDRTDARLPGLIEERQRCGQVRGELTFVRGDGTCFEGEFASANFSDHHGILRGVSIVRDLTPRLAAEANRCELEGQLHQAQKLEAVGAMASGIAHDFNNILAAILGNSALARSDLPAQHPAVECLTEIDKAGSRGKLMVERILAHGQRRQTHATALLPLRPLVEEAAGLMRAILPARISLTHSAVTSPCASVDPTQIVEVLMNLCTNAWHAIDGVGRIELGVDRMWLNPDATGPTATLRAGFYVCLSVTDNGTGIDAATAAHIFEPFFTTKAERQGTGLGLSVVDGIVRAHGGAIVLTTAPGAGSTFHVYLPAVDAPATADKPNPECHPYLPHRTPPMTATEGHSDGFH